MANHGTTLDEQAVPSQIFPDNLSAVFDDVDSEQGIQIRVFQLYWIWSGLMAAASGAVAILPDYLGYGVSYEHPRGYMNRYVYQQADAVLFFQSREYLREISDGCSILDQTVTLAGYSEGGYGSFAAGLALSELGVEIVTVQAGASPFDLNFNIGWAIGKPGERWLLSGPFLCSNRF